MRVLIGCEESGIVRDAFIARGHDAWSCDLEPTRRPGPHYQCDVRDVLDKGWDLAIFHTPCTRLANSGVRWLWEPPAGRTQEEMWLELYEGVKLYRDVKDAPIPKKAMENPIMHKYARWMTGASERHIVQPWWFGEPYFKATGFELINLEPLVPTNKLIPPEPGTDEHKEWSAIHRASPGPNRTRDRSVTFQGIADAMAEQWGENPVITD